MCGCCGDLELSWISGAPRFPFSFSWLFAQFVFGIDLIAFYYLHHTNTHTRCQAFRVALVSFLLFSCFFFCIILTHRPLFRSKKEGTVVFDALLEMRNVTEAGRGRKLLANPAACNFCSLFLVLLSPPSLWRSLSLSLFRRSLLRSP